MKLVLLLICSLLLYGCTKKADPPKDSASQIAPANPVSVNENPDSAAKPNSLSETSETIAPELRESKASESLIKNKRWKLVEIGGEKVAVTEHFKSDPYFTLSLQTNKIHGSGGCNRFGGTYTLEGDKLSIGRLVATKMMCEDASKVEDEFLRELQTADGFRVVGDAMWLLREGKLIMKFEAVLVN